MDKIKIGMLALIATGLVLGSTQIVQAGWFDSSSSWTNDDKKNFCHFYLSQEAGNYAESIVDSGSTFSLIPKEEMKRVSEYWQLALQEAQLVQDNVLDKVDAAMKQRYRNEYQRSFELKLDSMQTQNNLLMIQSSELHNKFIYWINDTKSRLKIPKGTRANCQN